MTGREFFKVVIEANVSDEVTAFAQKGIETLDKRNAKRASKPSKTAEANAPIKANILAVLSDTDKVLTAAQVATAIGVSTQKASALLRQMVDEGRAVSTEVKVKGKGKCKAYALAAEETEGE